MKYEIPINWQATQTIEVEADNLQQEVEVAVELFHDDEPEGYYPDLCIDDQIYDMYPDEDFEIEL